MPIGIDLVYRAILDIAVKIQALWVAEFSVWDGCRLGGPIRTHEATIDVRVISRSKIIKLGFAVAIFPSEFHRVVACGLTDARDNASPRIHIIVIEDVRRGSGFVYKHGGRVQVIGYVVFDVTAHVTRQALSAKEDVIRPHSR